ncbi:MAG: nucleotidyltransferase family protein [Myxococcales bacterium]
MRAAVILAAGASTRMGRPKPLVRLSDGRTFLQALAQCLRRGGVRGPLLVVTGASRARVAAEALRLGLVPIHNRRHRAGQLGSALTGLRAALRAGAAAILLLPCDMPHLRPATVARLLRAGGPSRPSHRGRPGHPLALDAASARAILAARGALSLRDALRRAGVRPRAIPTSDPAVRENVNREADLRRWR